jgi:6-phosphogluconolactonase
MTRLAVAVWVPKFQSWRITLTAPLLNHAANVLFLVSGKDKTEALRAVLQGEYQPRNYPAQLISPAQGNLTWLADRDAAVSSENPPYQRGTEGEAFRGLS